MKNTTIENGLDSSQPVFGVVPRVPIISAGPPKQEKDGSDSQSSDGNERNSS